MPARQSNALIPVGFSPAGGLSTEFGPYARFRLDPDGRVILPYLLTANNVTYNLDGWPRKMPGATRVNATTTGATDAVMGIFDYWRQGTAGTQVQKRLFYAGDNIFKDDADGVLDSLASGLELAKMPWCAYMNDEAILASTSNTDVPQVYDQTALANLGGTPPNFAFMVEHKDRMWASGVVANPSRLYYTALGLHEDWTGAGSGSIDFYSDNGDRITALHSTREELLVFKGPNHGSIYRLLGSSPTGAFAFAVVPFVSGVGCTGQQSMVRLPSGDLGWWDQNGVHALKTTAAFGDFEQAYLSAPIATLFRDELNHNRLDFVWGAAFPAASLVVWTVSAAGSLTNSLALALDFRFTPPRWARWPAYAAASVGMVLDGTRGKIPWWGTYTGFVLRGNSSSRTVNTSTYTAQATWPHVSVGGDPFHDWGLVKGRIAFQPSANADFLVTYRRDGHAAQTATVSQSGTVTLGDADAPSATDFMLNVDTLGGAETRHEFFDMEGQFKDLQLSLLDVVSAFEPHDLGVMIEDHGVGTVNTLG